MERDASYGLAARVNPVVAVAWGVWSSLPAQLWGVHHGSWYHYEASDLLDQDRRDGERQPREWQAAGPGVDSAVAALLRRYAQELNSTAVPISGQTLREIDHLHRRSRARWMLITADRGIGSTLPLRLGETSTEAMSGVVRGPVPLNLHALEWHMRALGAEVQTLQSEEGEWALQFALAGMPTPLAPHRPPLHALRHVVRCLAAAHPAIDRRRLLQARHVTDLNEALVLLQEAGGDPAVLRRLVRPLRQRVGSLSVVSRGAWQHTVESALRAWCSSARDADAERLAIVRVSAALSAWRVCREATEGLLDADLRGLWLARVYAATGRSDRARRCLGAVQASGRPVAERLLGVLEGRLARWRRLWWSAEAPATDGQVSLEPVGTEHATMLLYRYWDPQTALLVGLPMVKTPQDALAWTGRLQCGAEDVVSLAIMHSSYGFVGMVCAECRGDVAAFHFWVAAEVQGQGIGPRAASLLFRLLRRRGFRAVLTAVLPGNRRSLGAMRRLGFTELPLRALPPNQDMHLFGMALDGACADPHVMSEALIALYGELGSPLQFERRQMATAGN